MQALGTAVREVAKLGARRLPVGLTSPVHPYQQPRDSGWVKNWDLSTLRHIWDEPFVVILSTPTAVKVAEVLPWIHHSGLEPAAA